MRHGDIQIAYCKTEDMLADGLTKGASRGDFQTAPGQACDSDCGLTVGRTAKPRSVLYNRRYLAYIACYCCLFVVFLYHYKLRRQSFFNKGNVTDKLRYTSGLAVWKFSLTTLTKLAH
jgi:hypothetical protein